MRIAGFGQASRLPETLAQNRAQDLQRSQLREQSARRRQELGLAIAGLTQEGIMNLLKVPGQIQELSLRPREVAATELQAQRGSPEARLAQEFADRGRQSLMDALISPTPLAEQLPPPPIGRTPEENIRAAHGETIRQILTSPDARAALAGLMPEQRTKIAADVTLAEQIPREREAQQLLQGLATKEGMIEEGAQLTPEMVTPESKWFQSTTPTDIAEKLARLAALFQQQGYTQPAYREAIGRMFGSLLSQAGQEIPEYPMPPDQPLMESTPWTYSTLGLEDELGPMAERTARQIGTIPPSAESVQRVEVINNLLNALRQKRAIDLFTPEQIKLLLERK